MDNSKLVHVAVGIIINAQSQILLAQRAEEKHQGGCWEFPGGKVEKGETVEQALARELREEIGIEVVTAKALIKVTHHYPQKTVLLDVYIVSDYRGEAYGAEGQPLLWATLQEIKRLSIPEANQQIVDSLSKILRK